MAVLNNNGTPQVFNNVILQLDGTTEIDVQDYVTSIRYTSGNQSAHVQTINKKAAPIKVNAINSQPSGSITFAAGAFPTFYGFLNNRFVPFTLQLIQYTTGDLNGPTQSVLISDILLDDIGGSIEQSNPANMMTFGFKATDIQYI